MSDSTPLQSSVAHNDGNTALSGLTGNDWLDLTGDGSATPTLAAPAPAPAAPGAPVGLPSPMHVGDTDAHILLPPRQPSGAADSSSADSASRKAAAKPPTQVPPAQPAEREQSRTSSLAAVSAGKPRDIAKALAATDGWTGSQWVCLNKLWDHESDYETTVRNPSSGAYGIPQALPASKMASAGSDWRTNPVTQILWGLGYIGDRYGTPCGAWSHWLRHNSY